MRTSRTVLVGLVLATGLLATAQPGRTLDGGRPSATSTTVEDRGNALFAAAFAAYAAGDKARAFEQYEAAAGMGHVGALWKLGRMHELGDGIEADSFEAFRAYRALATLHGAIPPKDRDAIFVASAFVSLGDYLEHGIEGRLEHDLPAARRTFFYAASYFGDREAQYRLGRMLIDGTGGPPNPAQGVRWLKLASDKDHIEATAVLGELLFDGTYVDRRQTLGLAMLTRARRAARESTREWIEEMQMRAFAAASEDIRRQAVEQAEAEMSNSGG